MIINIFHLFISLFYYYISTAKFIPYYFYNFILFMGFYLLFNFRKFILFDFTSYYKILYSSHFYLFSPILLYIGIYKQKSNKLSLIYLKYSAFFMFFIHLYLILKKNLF